MILGLKLLILKAVGRVDGPFLPVFRPGNETARETETMKYFFQHVMYGLLVRNNMGPAALLKKKKRMDIESVPAGKDQATCRECKRVYPGYYVEGMILQNKMSGNLGLVPIEGVAASLQQRYGGVMPHHVRVILLTGVFAGGSDQWRHNHVSVVKGAFRITARLPFKE